jgi:hypothetical protein
LWFQSCTKKLVAVLNVSEVAVGVVQLLSEHVDEPLESTVVMSSAAVVMVLWVVPLSSRGIR